MSLDKLTGAFIDGYSGKNAVTNGGMVIKQRAASPSLSGITTPAVSVFGPDRMKAYLTANWSAGTITQAAGAAVGRTGYAAHVSGLSTSGAADLVILHRIEAKNAQRFKGTNGSLSVKVLHDVGSAVNVSLELYDADVADTFSAVTAITTTPPAATSVTSGSATTVTWENIDFSSDNPERGLEIRIKFAITGAITTKNFYVTELQLENGSTATAFEHRDIGIELSLCYRYVQPLAGFQGHGLAGGTAIQGTFTLRPTMRATPTLIPSTGVVTMGDGTTDYTQSVVGFTVQASSSNHFYGYFGQFTGITQYRHYTQEDSGYMLAVAEL